MAKGSTSGTSSTKGKTESTEQEGEGKKRVSKRVSHPLIGAAKGYPLEALPEDYDFKAHKPLKKKDFAKSNEGSAAFLEYRATVLDRRADKMKSQAEKLRTEAQTTRKYGDSKALKKAKKLINWRKQMAELEAELKAEGVDLSELGQDGE